MVDNKVLIGIPTEEYGRRADFYDYLNLLEKPAGSMMLLAHDRSPAHNRNIIVEEALKHNCTHVLFVDDDQTPRAGALLQLLEHDVDIVSGLYLRREYPHQPLIFDVADDSGACLYTYLMGDEPRLKKIVAAGLGFCLIKTSVFSRLEKPWFRLGELGPDQWCDDIGFFKRVREADIDIYCDTECRVGHIGTMIIWPNLQDGKWYTGYDTGYKNGMLNTPQVNPEVKYTKSGV